MTTFASREAIRDKIKALYDTKDSWNAVYSGMPKLSVMAGESPILTVLSDGSTPEFKMRGTNSLTHFYIITNWVLYRITNSSGVVTWDSDDAEDKLDELYTDVIQVMRDNASGATVGDLLEPLPQKSTIQRVPINNNYMYITETIPVKLYLATGSL